MAGSMGQLYNYDEIDAAMQGLRGSPLGVTGSFDNTLSVNDTDETFSEQQEQDWKEQYYNTVNEDREAYPGRRSLLINNKPEKKTKNCVGAMCEAVSKKMKKVKECVGKACTRKKRRKSSVQAMYGSLGGKRRRRSRKKKKTRRIKRKKKRKRKTRKHKKRRKRR